MTNLLSMLKSGPSGVVVASTIGVAVGITSTVTTVFSLFLVPISTELHAPRSSVSFVLILLAVSNALMFPVIGRMADRYGARILVLLGAVLFSFCIALVSVVESLMELYLTYILIGIFGPTLGPILFAKIIAGWFDKRRGLFLGVMGGVGNGIGSALMPIFVLMLLTDYGWRVAYQGIGVLILVVGFPVLYFLLHDPPQNGPSTQKEDVTPELGLTFSEARRTGVFWLMLVSIALIAGCLLAVFTHVIPVLTDRGISVQQATAVLSTFAVVAVIAQVAVGALLDKIERPLLITPIFVVAVLGLGIFASALSFPFLVLSGVLMGCGLGAEFGILPYAISRYFGLKDYGTITGLMYGTVAMMTGFMPVLLDVVFDFTASYDMALIGTAIGLLTGTAMMAKLPAFDALISLMKGGLETKNGKAGRDLLVDS